MLSKDEYFYKATLKKQLSGRTILFPRKEKMENQIICPHCHKTLSNMPIIDSAARKVGSGDESMICECGERITYWAITAQLREQNTLGRRFQNWIRGLSKS
jgi:hypothetical protein